MSDWRAFRFTPDDVLFFRDGRPSSLGEDHYLVSIFPPHPSTLYGALRTRRLLDAKAKLERLKDEWAGLPEAVRDEVGPWGGFGSLELRGPWLVRDDGVLVPAPADLAVVRATGSDPPRVVEAGRYRLESSASTGTWSHSLGLFRPYDAAGRRLSTAPPSASPDYWLTGAGLARWAAGEVPEPDALVHRDALFLPEPRTGVGLEIGGRLAAIHKLFTFGFIRLARGVAIGFEARGTALAAVGGLRLGGEAKMGELAAGPALPLPAAPTGNGPLTLAFLTPALSTGGASPPSSCRAFPLSGALVRGATLVGGWDLANNRSKPLRRAIPAGSVFVFEGDGGAELSGRNLSDSFGEEVARQGFGLAVAGTAPGSI